MLLACLADNVFPMKVESRYRNRFISTSFNINGVSLSLWNETEKFLLFIYLCY